MWIFIILLVLFGGFVVFDVRRRYKEIMLSFRTYINEKRESEEDAYDPEVVNYNNQYDYIHDYMTAPSSPQPMYTYGTTTTIPQRKRHISRPIRIRKRRYRGKR